MQKILDRLWKGWKLKELLGEGSFGKVYRIEKNEFGHTYESALKIISIPKSQAEIAPIVTVGMDEENVEEYLYSIVEELVDEFALMSKLKGHSHIVSYEDHGVVPFEEGIGWYLCVRMELLTPLLTYEKEHPLSEKDVVQMGIEICDALEACERYNIVHRDLKPENIFVNELGQFKIGDFGVAKQMEKTSQAFSRKGTASFMAPEVFKGGKGDIASDLCSLGIVLYLFLNQHRLPFYPNYPEQIRYTDKEKADSMRLSGVRMPKPVNASDKVGQIIQTACAYEPSQRYCHAKDMKKALEEMDTTLLEEKKIEIKKNGKGKSRSSFFFGLTVGILCLLTIGLYCVLKSEKQNEGDRRKQAVENIIEEDKVTGTVGEKTKEQVTIEATAVETGTTEVTNKEEEITKEASTQEEKKTTKEASTQTDKETTESGKKNTQKTTKQKTEKKSDSYEESIDSWDLIN